MFTVIETQETPNPDALKFILDSQVLAIGVRHFDNKSAGGNDPLAAPLFALGDVRSVFYSGNFVTVTKYPEAQWKTLRPQIEQVLAKVDAIIESGDSEAATTPIHHDLNAEEKALLEKINAVLDNNVRPALAGDGGGLQVLGLEGTTLRIHYQGACGSCPSASAGTMNAIQNLLRRMVDPNLTVTAG
jgi:NFU1 iron-sulfur cluster scaffold homolog, mitochondrial